MSKYIPIGDVCYVFDGPHATPTKTEEGPIYLGIDAITPDCRLNPAEYAHLSEADYTLWTKRVTPKKDDIVFSYEATLGRYAMIPEGFHGCLGRRLAIVRAKDDRINPRWLYYYFLSPEWRAFIANHTVRGSTVDRISVDDFPRYPIPDIERKTQDRIVSSIQSVDKRIDLNNSICAELESMAKTLYDYWFVQFDFPDANGKPYRASGGEMVWNKKLKREIPKGWNTATLGDICTFRNGINYDKSEEGDKEYKIINVRNITASTVLLDEKDLDHICLKQKQADTYRVSSEDIIIARSGAPGATRLINPLNNSIIFCGFIICCHPKTALQKLFITFSLKRLEGTAATKTGGSILQNVSQDTLKSVQLIVPPGNVLENYNELVNTWLIMMQNLINENRELGSLRNWLLPMLMNGQATVVPAESAPKLQVLQPEKPARDSRFDRWLQTQGVAARGTLDEQTLHDIFDAMDDDDKK